MLTLDTEPLINIEPKSAENHDDHSANHEEDNAMSDNEEFDDGTDIEEDDGGSLELSEDIYEVKDILDRRILVCNYLLLIHVFLSIYAVTHRMDTFNILLIGNITMSLNRCLRLECGRSCSSISTIWQLNLYTFWRGCKQLVKRFLATSKSPQTLDDVTTPVGMLSERSVALLTSLLSPESSNWCHCGGLWWKWRDIGIEDSRRHTEKHSPVLHNRTSQNQWS